MGLGRWCLVPSNNRMFTKLTIGFRSENFVPQRLRVPKVLLGKRLVVFLRGDVCSVSLSQLEGCSES